MACSIVVGTDGLVGGAGVSDGAPDDVATDGTSTPGDAVDGTTGTDAPVDVTEAGVKCVDGPLRFCDDFDSPVPGSKWDSTTKIRGDVAFEDVGVSPPRAMHASILAGSGTSGAVLGKVMSGNPSGIRCELDLKLDAISATGETDVLAFITKVGDVTKHTVYLATFGANKWELAEFADAEDGGPPLVDRSVALSGALPYATWFHVIAEVHPTEVTRVTDAVTHERFNLHASVHLEAHDDTGKAEQVAPNVLSIAHRERLISVKVGRSAGASRRGTRCYDPIAIAAARSPHRATQR